MLVSRALLLSVARPTGLCRICVFCLPGVLISQLSLCDVAGKEAIATQKISTGRIHKESQQEEHMKIPKIALVLVVFVVATTIAAQAQTNVFVPGNASGYFGRPADRLNPLVSAITVTGPATITVT